MRSRWPILAILCFLASLLVPGIASASTAASAETRVWAFDLGDQVRVGLDRSLTPELRYGCEPGYDQLASDSLLAARGARGLGEDFAKALDDIAVGRPRPNVKNPKPFANDGRGGAPRLPGRDGAGNPISYTEHYVNPRPPGGVMDSNRIVTGSDGSILGTTDHFGSWTRIQ